MNDEQALSGFFDGNRVLSCETVTIEFVLTVSFRLGRLDGCNFRLKGIAAMR
jgi:hypothetical protein